MSQIVILAYIGLGGALGACSRYLVSEACAALLGRSFPYGTLAVNVTGSLAMGLLMAAFANGSLPSEPWRQVIGLGFLGALTTFSTFSMDNVVLMQQGAILKMAVNVLVSVLLSLTACWVGFQIMSRS